MWYPFLGRLLEPFHIRRNHHQIPLMSVMMIHVQTKHHKYETYFINIITTLMSQDAATITKIPPCFNVSFSVSFNGIHTRRRLASCVSSKRCFRFIKHGCRFVWTNDGLSVSFLRTRFVSNFSISCIQSSPWWDKISVLQQVFSCFNWSLF